jgi:hypothetical protein
MMAKAVCEGQTNVVKSMVMQRGRRAKGGIKRKTVMQCLNDTKRETSHIGIVRNRKLVITRGRQTKVVGCGSRVRRVWKRQTVHKMLATEAASGEQDISIRKEENGGGGEKANEDDLCSNTSALKPLTKIETEQGIKEWRSRYLERAATERYITGLLSQEKNSQLVRSHRRIIPILAELALLKDNLEKLVEQHGSLYRWVWQYEKPTERDGELCHLSYFIRTVEEGAWRERHRALPAGWRWMMQLNVRRQKDTQDCWWDWVFIKKSNIAGGNLGLFAGRCFPKGSIVGYYVGPAVWTCDMVGTEEPSEEYLTAQGVPDSAYCICLLNRDCVWNCIEPKPVRQKPGEAMYLGMHYINNVCLCFQAGSPEYETAKKYQNCVLVDEGSVKALKKICPGAELFTAYSKDENVVRSNGGGHGMDSVFQYKTDRNNRNNSKLEL